LFQERAAITRTLAIIVALVILAAAGAGVYFLGSGQSQSGSKLIDMSIVETDPVNQIDSFNPGNITATHGTTVTIAIQNGDDETRMFQIGAFNVNQTVVSGQTIRVSFTVGQAGTFKIFSPQTAPSAASNGRPGSAITGYLTVT
jgi:plastocyanin